MSRLDRQMFEQLSKQTRYQVDFLEKVYRLTELLKEITSTEMEEKVKPVLEYMCDFSEREEKFIRTFFDDKKYKIDILFEDDLYNESVREHPGIEWRLKNL